MKKFLLIAAAAIGMVGCSNEDLVIEEAASTPITLKAVTKKASRGGTDLAALPMGTTIYCTGLLHGDGSSSYYFTNKSFISSDKGSTWSNNSIVWPIDGNMDFWAYTCSAYTKKSGEDPTTGSPYTYYDTADYPSSLTPVYTKNGNDFASVTLDFGNTLNGENDVMISDIVNVACSGKTSPQLTFNHTMAWLVVNVSSAAASDFMKIYSIKVNDVKVSGSLTASVTGSGLTYSWTPYRADGATEDEVRTLNFPAYGADSEAVLLGEAANYTLSGLMVLPQQQTSITMTYAYKGDDDYGTKLTHTIDLTDASIKDVVNNTHYTDWDMSHKYTYTIKISSDNTISLTAKVNTFEEIGYESTI